MKILTYTTLYPNAAQPVHGVFVENRLRQLLRHGGIEAEVIAPVPWFPFTNSVFGRYSIWAKVPARERRFGVTIHHPRFPVLPKLGMSIAPWLLYSFTRPPVDRILADGFRFDLVDAHYFYPDGVAAALLARVLRKPLVITARGSDVNIIANYRIPRRMIRWAACQAAGIVTVSAALKERLVALGVAKDRISVLRNGVDLTLFSPSSRPRSTEQSLTKLLLSVGNLVELKGHDLVIKALAEVPGARLAVVGSGPEQGRLASLAREMGLSDRVSFLGQLRQEELAGVYARADLLVLASRSEGWPNVLLEAMACGTPVVASEVGGVAEIVNDGAAGLSVRDRTPTAFAAAIRRMLDAPPPRGKTRAYAERFGWDATVAAQLRLYEEAIGRCRRDGRSAGARDRTAQGE